MLVIAAYALAAAQAATPAQGSYTDGRWQLQIGSETCRASTSDQDSVIEFLAKRKEGEKLISLSLISPRFNAQPIEPTQKISAVTLSSPAQQIASQWLDVSGLVARGWKGYTFSAWGAGRDTIRLAAYGTQDLTVSGPVAYTIDLKPEDQSALRSFVLCEGKL